MPPAAGGRAAAHHGWGAPQVTVSVDLASLLGAAPTPGAFGWGGMASPATARRLACDAALTRLLTTPHPEVAQPAGPTTAPGALTTRLHAALAGLPPALGGTPRHVLDLGRATRVVPAGLRRALAARDRGCTAPGCDRPPPTPTPTTCATGWTAGRPAWPTWCCCAAPTTAPPTTATSSSPTAPTATPTHHQPPGSPLATGQRSRQVPKVAIS